MRVLCVAVLAGLVLGGAAHAGSIDYYLKIDGVQGEVSSVHTGPMTVASLNTPRTHGAYAQGSLTLTRTHDALSVTLIKANVRATHFPLVEIGVGTKTICLVDASVGKVTESGGAQPTESVSFNYEQVSEQYSGGGCSRGKDPAVFALTGDSGGIHARIDCLIVHCAGELTVAGVGKAAFSVPGGSARTVHLPTRSIRPGTPVQGTIVLRGRSTPIVEQTVVAAAPSAGSGLILTCAVAGQQGVATSIDGNAPKADAGQTAAIAWTAPSGKIAIHDAKVDADGNFKDTLTPDEPGTWSGVARLGAMSTNCSILVAATVG